jgi:hypothetical protein
MGQILDQSCKWSETLGFSRCLFSRVVQFPFSWVSFRYFPLGFLFFYFILFDFLCLLEMLVSYFLFHWWFSFCTMFVKIISLLFICFFYILYGCLINLGGLSFLIKCSFFVLFFFLQFLLFILFFYVFLFYNFFFCNFWKPYFYFYRCVFFSFSLVFRIYNQIDSTYMISYG